MRNKDNWTPLHIAVRRGNLASTKALLEVGGNKPQKSWLQAKSSNSLYVDIDAIGGTDRLTCLHLASMNAFYDIVDLLFQHKANMFEPNAEGKTVFTSVQNNLLMIKLLKKEEKAYFNDNYRSRRNVKEMHITNSTFVRQALQEKSKRGSKKEMKTEPPEYMRDYRTLGETL